MAAVLARRRVEYLLDCAGLPDPIRVGGGVYRVQLAAGALLADAGGHAHLREPDRCGVARLDIRGRGGDVERGAWRGDGGRRRDAGGPRHGPVAATIGNPQLI